MSVREGPPFRTNFDNVVGATASLHVSLEGPSDAAMFCITIYYNIECFAFKYIVLSNATILPITEIDFRECVGGPTGNFYNDQVYSFPRDGRLSASWGS